ETQQMIEEIIARGNLAKHAPDARLLLIEQRRLARSHLSISVRCCLSHKNILFGKPGARRKLGKMRSDRHLRRAARRTHFPAFIYLDFCILCGHASLEPTPNRNPSSRTRNGMESLSLRHGLPPTVQTKGKAALPDLSVCETSQPKQKSYWLAALVGVT